MKVWLLRSVKMGVSVLAVSAMALLLFILIQPGLPDDHLRGARSIVIDQRYGAAADSSLDWARAVASIMHLPSLSLAASVDGKVVWEAAMGYRDLDDLKEATPSTLYRAGSVAKPLTSVVLARLIAADVLEWTTPVGELLPELSGPLARATPRQLAGHMAGVRHYVPPGFSRTFWMEQFGQRHYEHAREALGMFIDDPLLFQPGGGFRYTTHGYTLLAAAMEAATGRGYLELLEQQLTRPLGLRHTGPDDVTREVPGRAVPYDEIWGHYDDRFTADPSYRWAGGGLLSTSPELVRVAGALITGEVLDPYVVELLWTPQRLPNGKPNAQNYALGWRIGWEAERLGLADSVRVVHHGGTSQGGSSFLLLVPGDSVAVAAMANLSVWNPAPLRRAVLRMAGVFVRSRRSPGGAGRSLSSASNGPAVTGNGR